MNYIYFKNHKNHPSGFAGFLTILSYFIILILGILFSLDILLKRNPTSYFFKKFIPDAGYYYLNSSGIFHYFQLLTPNDEVRIDPDSFVVIGTETYIDSFLGKVNFTNEDYWIYDLCSKKDIKEFEHILTDEQFEKSVCIRKFYNKTTKRIYTTDDPDFPYPSLKHGTGSTNPSKPNKGYGAYVAYCDDTMPHRTTPCKSLEEKEKEKSEIMRVSLGMIDNDFDVTLYKDPIVRNFINSKNHLTGKSITNNNLNFNPVQINTDDGFVFRTSSSKNSFRLDLIEKTTYEPTDETSIISAWYFLMGNRQETYDRSYQKIQEVLASVGGTSKAILMIAQILNYCVNQYRILLDTQMMLETLGVRNSGIQENSRMYKASKVNTNHSSPAKNDTVTNRINVSQTNNYLIKTTNSNHFPLNQIPTNPVKSHYPLKKIKTMSQKKISFWEFVKSHFSTKSNIIIKIELINSFWKSKVSEENIVQMHLYIQRILQNFPEIINLKFLQKREDFIT